MKRNIDLVIDDVPLVGLGHSTDVGFLVALTMTLRERKESVSIAFPLGDMPRLLGRLHAATAAATEHAVYAEGGSEASVRPAQELHALDLVDAGVSSKSASGLFVTVEVTTSDGTVLPLRMPRDAAVALMSALREAFAN